MREITHRLWAISAAAILWAGACASEDDDRYGGESHWLGACDCDADCAEGRCLCGICTITCSEATECGPSPQNACVAASSPPLADVCTDLPPSGAICLHTCETERDCGGELTCLSGRCAAARGDAEADAAISSDGSEMSAPTSDGGSTANDPAAPGWSKASPTTSQGSADSEYAGAVPQPQTSDSPDGGGCEGGACPGNGCPEGFLDCDGVATNGCETDVTEDPQNCGACGHDCTVGACAAPMCRGGHCAVLPHGASLALQVDGDHLYSEWGRVSLTDFTSTPLMPDLLHGWTHETPYVYYRAFNDVRTAIYRQPESGGEPTQIIDLDIALGGIDVEDGILVFADTNADTVYAYTEDGSSLLWSVSTGGRSPSGLIIVDSWVYWGNRYGDTLERVPLTGGTPTTLVTGAWYPTHLSVRGGYLYWEQDNPNNALLRTPLSGGAVETIRSVQASLPINAFAVDDLAVYWTDYLYAEGDRTTLMKASLSDLTAQVGVTQGSGFYGVTVDDTCLYYSGYDGKDGFVARVPK